MNRKYRFIFIHLSVAILFFSGCHTSQITTASRTHTGHSSAPRFIDSIQLNDNNNCLTLSKQLRKKPAEKYNPSETNALQIKYGEMMEVTPQELTNLSLYDFIDNWMGVRYRLGGNDTAGIDCSAFVQRLYEEVYSVNLVRTALEQFTFCKIIKDKKELKEGDLVFFRIRSKRISHVGIYLANDHFVHASRSSGVMISDLNSSYWKRYYAGAGRIPLGDI